MTNANAEDIESVLSPKNDIDSYSVQDLVYLNTLKVNYEQMLKGEKKIPAG